MSAISKLKTGILYRNPIPHVRSEHAYFPSVALMDNGEMLASVVLGEAFEAVNLHSWVFRSKDMGETWKREAPLLDPLEGRPTSDFARITAFPGGEIAAFVIRHDRSGRTDEGLTSHETLGFVPTELLLVRSRDYGRTWSAPETLNPPLVGPAFEICCPIVPLRDGRWILPTQTWPAWDGCCPNGIRMVAFVSHDRGKTWPEFQDVMREPDSHVYYWESKIAECRDGSLLAIAWVYDDDNKKDRPNAYALSRDGGRTWSAPRSTGLCGQTAALSVLADGRLLVAYRRMDKPGFWVQIARLEGDSWVNGEEHPLWGDQSSGLTATTADMAHNFNVLRFGAPCITHLPDGTCYIAFWCYEDCVSNIRWFKIGIN